ADSWCARSPHRPPPAPTRPPGEPPCGAMVAAARGAHHARDPRAAGDRAAGARRTAARVARGHHPDHPARRVGLRGRRAAAAVPHPPLGGHARGRLHAVGLARARVADRADLPRADRRHRARAAAATAQARERHRHHGVGPGPGHDPRPGRGRGRRTRPPAHRDHAGHARGRDVTPEPDAPAWRRLDKRMLAVTPLSGAVRLLPVAVVILLTGQGDAVARLWVPLGIALALVLAGVVRWRTTKYRITADRVELHTGWLRRQRRSVPRDRIRTVDLTAKLVHRVFGLSVVHVSAAAGSGSDSSGLDLDAVSKAEADWLRRELLDRPAPPAAEQATAAEPPAARHSVELARLDWSWLRFAPLTFSSIAGIGAVFAAVYNLFHDLGVDPRDVPAVDDAADRLAAAPLWVGVGVLGALLLAAAVIGSLLLFA